MIQTNAPVIAARLDAAPAAAGLAARQVIRHHTMLTKTRIMRYASGRPGPNVITGDYRASWTDRYADTGVTFTGTVGTDRPQGRRLEYGFVGADILGRVFNQPPYPHVAPAVAETAAELPRDMGIAIGRVL